MAMNHYEVIERAIIYLSDNYTLQPNLDDAAANVGLSPSHFQRVFLEWAGVSPKKFLQYISAEQAKGMLRQRQSILNTSLEVGLSGTSRLHDLFITTEGMTPGEYKSGAANLIIVYSAAPTRFGKVLIASTNKGVCYLAFWENTADGLHDLALRFPLATLVPQVDSMHVQVAQTLQGESGDVANIKLHLKGTPFQLKVWEALLRLPEGTVTTYSDIARCIGIPKSARAVGSAVGGNPIAYLIPCHRVIRSTGIIGEYRWGAARKKAILGWEAANRETT
jgi:AraC family transcriptional regulator, regulatory protein of adaptative response / methylated-DNA-[protein]-cysteine methyltransferase